MEKQKVRIGPAEIQAVIPHRPPFLFVDEIVEFEPGIRAIGLLHVSPEMSWVKGHFPGHPIMPGVLIIEALAQAAAFTVLSDRRHEGKLPLFAGIENCRFKRKVLPGETLELDVRIMKMRDSVGKCACVARVGKDLVATTNLVVVVKP